MRRIRACIVVSAVCISSVIQAQENRYAVYCFGSFTTSSKVFTNIHSSEEILRNRFLPIDNIFGYGIDLRRNMENLRIQIGINIQYLAKTKQYIKANTQGIQIRFKDGYRAYPLEFSAYFNLPISHHNPLFYMGGGFGIYFGNRDYGENGVRARIIELKPSVGIHILCGGEYFLSEGISIRSELKFRDIHFTATHAFAQSDTDIQDSKSLLETDRIYSRINIDGMTISIGTVYHF